MIQAEMNFTDPTIAQILVAQARIYRDSLIKELELKDQGRKRSRHKESIKFIKQFNMTYELRAGEYLPEENQFWLGIKEGFAFLIFLIGICSVLTLIAAVMS